MVIVAVNIVAVEVDGDVAAVDGDAALLLLAYDIFMEGDISISIVDPHSIVLTIQGLLVVNNALQVREGRREPGGDHAGAQRQREANRQGLFQKFHCIFPFFAFFGRKGSGSRAAVAEPNDLVHTVGPLTLRPTISGGLLQNDRRALSAAPSLEPPPTSSLALASAVLCPENVFEKIVS